MKHILTLLAKKIDASDNNIPTGEASTILTTGLNMVYFIAGAIAVIMVIAGGIMYVISAGDPGKIKKAKDLIIYSVVGLVVVIIAYAVTAFVMKVVA